MVIFDTENNNKGKAKGRLHLNVMDIDYIVSKYGIDELSKFIHMDYIDCFKRELNKRKGEDAFSVQYFASLNLGIESEYDENLLNLIKSEVADGMMFTKKDLVSMDETELDQIIDEIECVSTNYSQENLYKIRSYKMVKFISQNIAESQDIIRKLHEPYPSEDRADLELEYRTIMKNLVFIGLSKDIAESDYFSVKKIKL